MRMAAGSENTCAAATCAVSNPDLNSVLLHLQRHFFSLSSLQATEKIVQTLIKLSESNPRCEGANGKWQDLILASTIHHKQNLQYQVSKEFQKKFLKCVVNAVEESGVDPLDDLFCTYAKLLKKGDCETDNIEVVTFKSYCIDRSEKAPCRSWIAIKESLPLISHGTTGLHSWPGAVILASWCFDNISLLQGKHLLEVGCGSGLTGISAVLKCNPTSYIFTDCNYMVVNVLLENLKLNQIKFSYFENPSEVVLKRDSSETQVFVGRLDWEDKLDWEFDFSYNVDIVLAADVVFDPVLVSPLVKTLLIFLKEPTRTAIVCCVERNSETLKLFERRLGEYGCTFEFLQPPKETFVCLETDARVYIYRIFLNKQESISQKQ